MASTTAIFNVGGQQYNVPRGLVLDKYPDSLLAKTANETWQNDPDATVHIDADGERFRYCVEYLRCGEVNLPLSVSKSSVLEDLDYYGIKNVDTTDIHSSSDDLLEAAQTAQAFLQHVKELQECDDIIEALAKKKRYIACAHLCYSICASDICSLKLIFQPRNSSHDVANKVFLELFDKALFNECLEKYGMYLIRLKCCRSSTGKVRGEYEVTIGPLEKQSASP